MKKADVVKLYGSEAAAAAALEVTKQAVNGWGDVIPEGMAYKVQVISGGRLKVDPAVYRRLKKTRMAA